MVDNAYIDPRAYGLVKEAFGFKDAVSAVKGVANKATAVAKDAYTFPNKKLAIKNTVTHLKNDASGIAQRIAGAGIGAGSITSDIKAGIGGSVAMGVSEVVQEAAKGIHDAKNNITTVANTAPGNLKKMMRARGNAVKEHLDNAKREFGENLMSGAAPGSEFAVPIKNFIKNKLTKQSSIVYDTAYLYTLANYTPTTTKTAGKVSDKVKKWGDEAIDTASHLKDKFDKSSLGKGMAKAKREAQAEADKAMKNERHIASKNAEMSKNLKHVGIAAAGAAGIYGVGHAIHQARKTRGVRLSTDDD